MNKLLAITVASVSIAVGSIPVSAEVDAKTHKLCLEAKDYLGCVQAMTGEVSEQENDNSTRFIYGGREQTPNVCPNAYAYVGAGYCRKIECKYARKNNPQLAGKEWHCNRKLLGRNSLTWGEQQVPATYNPVCPNIEPEVGFQTSCGMSNPFTPYDF